MRKIITVILVSVTLITIPQGKYGTAAPLFIEIYFSGPDNQ